MTKWGLSQDCQIGLTYEKLVIIIHHAKNLWAVIGFSKGKKGIWWNLTINHDMFLKS